MIRLTRTDLPEVLATDLDRRASALARESADSKSARKKWDGAKACRIRLREQLKDMAAGLNRCMYCGDNLGTDVDHFAPLFFSPLRAFDWFNHLLACSYCNSHTKREQFPVAADGTPLLVDPCAEDPSEHLFLVLSSGSYEALTHRGTATIQVFGLNRRELTQGRQSAFFATKLFLKAYLGHHDDGQEERAAETLVHLDQQPFADVREAMRWTSAHAPAENAAALLGGADMVRALEILGPRWAPKPL
ncbi:HNH endonuclease family protein [Nocardiopsis aegyptia]|uniref:HNH endonuclease n=1 Tax=Nocardiopsis aegyptia TaxID=220378 RepID=A0A7Z0ERU3_9ACTN|nr:HNH endonuclease [Nocardiopsis aegyptia]NYJ36163.1 hypothetical protein [Nocardiopsis aegyptia]